MERGHLAEIPVRWGDGYVVRFGFDERDGRMCVTEWAIYREDETPLTAVRPPITRLAAQAHRELRGHWAPAARRSRSEAARRAAEALLAVPGPRPGRPPFYGPEHWRGVARVYREGGLTGLCRHYSISRSTAWKWSQRARRL